MLGQAEPQPHYCTDGYCNGFHNPRRLYIYPLGSSSLLIIALEQETSLRTCRFFSFLGGCTILTILSSGHPCNWMGGQMGQQSFPHGNTSVFQVNVCIPQVAQAIHERLGPLGCRMLHQPKLLDCLYQTISRNHAPVVITPCE